MPNQHTNEERLSSAQAARIAALPGRWSRTKLSRRLHYCRGEQRITLCGIHGAYPNGQSWAEVDLRGACNRCVRLLPTLCPEPAEPTPTPAGASSVSSSGSPGSNSRGVTMLFILCAFLFGSVTPLWSGLPADFDGIDDWQAATGCDALASDLTYAVRAVVIVPPDTQPTTTGRAAFCAASESDSKAYICIGFPDNLMIPDFTHRTGSTFYSARGTTTISDGQQHVLCGVADVGSISLYVDGVLAGTRSLSGASPSQREICRYGALERAPGGTRNSFWKGTIVSVATWDRALSPDEIQANCTSAPAQPTLEPCHGHTGLVWAPYTDTSVGFFEVERTVTGVGSWTVMGDTREKNREGFTDEEGETFPPIRAGSWDLLRAWSIPAEGVHYSYRIKAVRASDGVRSIPSNVVDCGPQDPTLCYPVECQ